MFQGTLTVRPIAAQLTKDQDWFGRQDPYCVIEVGSQKQRSRTHTDGGKNPSWNDSLSFQINGEQQVHISVFDRDILTRDDFICDTTIPLMTVFQRRQHSEWFPLYRKGRSGGRINVRLEFIPSNQGFGYPPQTPQMPQMPQMPYMPYPMQSPYQANPYAYP